MLAEIDFKFEIKENGGYLDKGDRFQRHVQ